MIDGTAHASSAREEPLSNSLLLLIVDWRRRDLLLVLILRCISCVFCEDCGHCHGRICRLNGQSEMELKSHELHHV